MLYTSYYIFRPKPELLQKVDGLDLEDITELSEPTLWKHDHGNGFVADNREIARALKLLFLGNVTEILLSSSDLDCLGINEYNVEQFDRFWELECYGGCDENVERVLKNLRDAGFEKNLKATGNRQLLHMLETPNGR